MGEFLDTSAVPAQTAVQDYKFKNEPDVIETGYVPHALQYEIHMRLKRFSVLVCHRRFGKTVLAINTLVDAAARTKKKKARYAYVAPFRNQAKDIAWSYLKEFSSRIPGVVFNESELTVVFPNEATIKLYGADNAEAMRGLYFMGIVVDEVADMEPKVWTEILRPTLTDYKGWCLFIGTPKGVNLFSQLYYKGLSGAHKDWYAESFPATRSLGVLPWITEEELNAAREDMSEAKYRQEYLCDFEASSDNILITIDLYRKAIAREPDMNIARHMPKIISVDVARYGNDTSTIFKRQGLASFPIITIKHKSNDLVADRVAGEYDRWDADAIIVDGGRGEGVIDILRRRGYTVFEVNSQEVASNPKRYANKRTEMYDETQKWLAAGGCLHHDPQLEAEITAPHYSFDKKDAMILEKKDDIKERLGRSPDKSDVVALSHAVKIRPKDTGTRDSSGGSGARRSHYSVFSRRNH